MAQTTRDRTEVTAVAPEQQLRTVGLRVTAPRLAVLEVLAEHPHADAAAVLGHIRRRDRGISVQGVYDVLTALTDAGLLRRVQPGHSVARYELHRGDNHHHLVCRACRAISDVPCLTGHPPCLETSGPAAAGFTVDEAEIIFWGLCPSCQQPPRPTEKKEQE